MARIEVTEEQAPVRRYRMAKFFVYVPTPVVVQLSDSQPTADATINLQTDSDFELLAITYAADIGGAVQTYNSRVIPLVTMTLQVSGTGNDIMPQPVPLSSIGGNGELPFLLPESTIWHGSSQISITLSRYAQAGTTYNIRLAFHGRKLFF